MSRMRTRSLAARDWLRQWPKHHRDQAIQLADLVHGANSRIEEAVKWKRLTFTIDENWQHWLCGVAVTKQGGRLVFHKGALLHDPLRLLTGSGRYVRDVPHDVAMANRDAVVGLISQAVTHQYDVLDES